MSSVPDLLQRARPGLARLYGMLPLRVRRAGWRMAARLPPLFDEVLLPVVIGRRPAAVPPAVSVPRTRVRLYVGPANSAGQGDAWARAAERVPGAGARSMGTFTTFGYPADSLVDVTVLASSRRWQQAQRRAVHRFTHVLVESERPLFPRLSEPGTVAEVRSLLRRGLHVATVSHGSDVRLPSRHAGRERWSPFRDGTDLATSLEAAASRNLAWLDRLRDDGVPAYVSTPDLLADVPWATWLPVVVDPGRWASDRAPLRRRVPVVAHVPSHSALKGTDVVDPVLRALEREGRLEYRSVTGLGRDAMVDLYRDADVVLDQFRLGIYGVATCEALAAGRVVVSHVSDEVREHVRSTTGLPLPVVEADGDSLRDTLLGLLDDRDGARDVASAGPGFVAAVHDGRAAARALEPFLLSGAGRGRA